MPQSPLQEVRYGLCQTIPVFTLKARNSIFGSMARCRITPDDRAAHVWRALVRCVTAFALAMALLDPVLETPAAAMPSNDGVRSVSVSLPPSEQGGEELLSQALACHMYFEHHQLVRFEIPFVSPAFAAVRACYSTRVVPLASLNPCPLRRPPRI